jgi:hypothetical protein
MVGLGVGVTEELHVFKSGNESMNTPTINFDFGFITKEDFLITGNFGLHQNEPTPEHYSITGNTFGDPRSGSYITNEIYTIGGGPKVLSYEGATLYIFGEVGGLTKTFRPIYRDPMGILGGSDNRYITNTGEQETHIVMGGGLLVTYDKYYGKISGSAKSVVLSVGISFTE